MALTPIYVPPPGLRTSLEDFRDAINQKYNLLLTSYADVHSFSVTRLNDFWSTFWTFAGIRASVQPPKAVDDEAAIDEFPRFFTGARLNFAENILSRQRDGLAVIELDENSLEQPRIYTWRHLRELVQKYADALRSSGLAKGEVVALVGSNCVRSLALLLATTTLGGIFSSFATDMGATPRFLFAESSYSYNGKRHDISTKLETCIKNLRETGSCNLVVIGSTQGVRSKSTSFNFFLARATGREVPFEQVPFDTPLVVMFSSGTTGTPKGIVHSHGGLVINGTKEFLLHNNLGPSDMHFHYTNIGWTLWNISIGALFTGSRLILYDGSPFYPTAERFLELLFKHRITSFGAGPRYFSELQKQNVKPKKYAQHLHSIVSTGAVLTPALAEWLVEAFGPVCQISKSGGTELCGAFLHGTRSLPSFPGEMSVKALGLDVAVFSHDGKPLPDGQSGELVCKKPAPNLPRMFWKDPERKRYYASYFTKFPHVWTHGDFIQINPDTKGISVLGRSDGVLNPSGVRFGSSEIYNVLSRTEFNGLITDAIVVGQQRITSDYSDPTERVVLFIKCTPRASTGSLRLSQELEISIRNQIETNLSRRHVPAFIFETDEVPYNANGKKLEIQVKAILCGGGEALSKLKLTEEEFRQVREYEKFYHVEEVVRSLSRERSRL